MGKWSEVLLGALEILLKLLAVWLELLKIKRASMQKPSHG
jgi:hypothetical protein